jgi:hypothetical protein
LNINATLYGQYVILFAVIMGGICYYVGRRKTQTPVLSALLGALLSIMPPFGLVYLVALVLKKDLTSALPE